MEGFDKIRNLNLAELGDDDDIVDQTGEEMAEAADNDMSADAVEVALEEADIPKVKDKIAEPVGKHYFVDADIMENEVRSFLFGHNYRQPVAILINLVAILLPFCYWYRGENVAMAAFVGIALLVYYPFTIYMRAKKVKNQNSTFSETFHYMFDEVGCHLQLSSQAIDVEWKLFTNIMIKKSVVVIYTSRMNGYLVPTKDMGNQKEEIIAFLKEHIKKK